MKIGILTFHRSINYGAVTQCYALTKELIKHFPDDTIEVVDYAPQFRLKKYKPTLNQFLLGSVKKQNTFPQNIKVFLSQALRLIKRPEDFKLLKARYDAFSKSLDILPLSEDTYYYDDAEQFRQAVYGKYDVLVVGSDCVWEWTTVPLPNGYYLCGNYGAKKASFAASVGTDDYQALPEDKKNEISQALHDFSYIGVRDTSSEYVMQQACPELVFQHNCDPTTFLDPKDLVSYRQIAKKKLEDAGISFDKPIVGLMCNEKLGKLARDIFNDSVQYVGLYVPNRYCDVNLLDLQVLEWAAIFELFDITITTFFHGTMLSLVNSTPVLSFDYLPETEKQHTKLHELYTRINLPGFYYRGKTVYTETDISCIGATAWDLIKNPPKDRIVAEIQKEALHKEGFFEYIKSMHR